MILILLPNLGILLSQLPVISLKILESIFHLLWSLFIPVLPKINIQSVSHIWWKLLVGLNLLIRQIHIESKVSLTINIDMFEVPSFYFANFLLTVLFNIYFDIFLEVVFDIFINKRLFNLKNLTSKVDEKCI
jgi:hypothetical protein